MSLKSHLQLAGTATVGPKGQVVIPADVREKMGIAPGDKLVALYIEGKQSIAFVTERQFQLIIDKFGEQVTELKQFINNNTKGE